MSHFSLIETQLTNQEFLVKALQDMGYAVQQGGVLVHGYEGNRTRAELKIATSNPDYDIGFVKRGNVFGLVADWHGIFGIDAGQFMQKLNQRYAYHASITQLKEQGFSVASEEVQKDGQIRLVLRRCA